MPRENISFATSDGVTLRGWLYTPSSQISSKCPCLVMAHGFAVVKEIDLDAFAEYFSSQLPLSCVVFDHRGYGDSDCAPTAPAREIIPMLQVSDYTDAITYAQSLPHVDAEKIGIWGSSYSGGHVLLVGVVDRRVKCVLSQVPLVGGWATFERLVRSDLVGEMDKTFEQDRLARFSGKEPGRLPIVEADPSKPCALPNRDCYEFFSTWEKKSNWKNDVTVKSIEAFRGYFPAAQIERISPTPLLMTVCDNDTIAPVDLNIAAFMRAREPKKLSILQGDHFQAYAGPQFQRNATTQVEWLKAHLLS